MKGTRILFLLGAVSLAAALGVGGGQGPIEIADGPGPHRISEPEIERNSQGAPYRLSFKVFNAAAQPINVSVFRFDFLDDQGKTIHTLRMTWGRRLLGQFTAVPFPPFAPGDWTPVKVFYPIVEPFPKNLSARAGAVRVTPIFAEFADGTTWSRPEGSHYADKIRAMRDGAEWERFRLLTLMEQAGPEAVLADLQRGADIYTGENQQD